MAINSAISSNYFQIILPCYMLIQMIAEIETIKKVAGSTVINKNASSGGVSYRNHRGRDSDQTLELNRSK